MSNYRKTMSQALQEMYPINEDNIDLMRKAAGGAAQTVKMKDGKLKMDMFTASAIMQILDKVNPANKKKMTDMINKGTKDGMMKLQDFAMKQVKSENDPEIEEDVDLDEVDRSTYSDRMKKFTAMLKDAEKEKPLDKKWISMLKDKIKSTNADQRRLLGMSEEVDLDEGYLELTFKSKQDAEKAYNKINNEIFAAGVVPYDDMNQEGNEIQFDLDGNLNRRNDILKDLKSGGIKNFKVTANEDLDEGTKEEYEKFFNGALKKFKIDSPADLKSDEEKKKFFNYIDKNYTGEKDEDFESRLKETIGIEESFEIGTNEYRDHALDVTPGETDPEWAQARDFKVASMKEALAKIWGMEEGKNPFIKKEDDDKALTKGTKSGITMTGKKAAIIDTKPKIKD